MKISRPHIVLAALIAVLACALLATPASARYQKRATFTLVQPSARASADCGDTDARAGEASEDALASSTVCLLNRERTSRGLRALRVNRRLSAAAQSHTNDMVRRRYFSHFSRSGSAPVDRIRGEGYMSGARSWMIGENLAWGSGSLSSPRSIVRAWMNSPGHRQNILTGRFREIGIGVASRAPVSTGGNAAATYTTTFGQRD